MEKAQTLISVIEFKRLLIDIRQCRPDICVRFRLLGEMWAVQFMAVLAVSDKGAIFTIDGNNSIVVVSDLTNIMQFEIDKPFRGYQPYFHYEVHPTVEVILK